MRKSTAKALLPLISDVWEYFGLGRHGGSHYKHRRPFCPGAGPLSITAPRQLHHTARHDGVYIQMDGLGCPDLRRDVIEMLDGIPYQVMREAVSYVEHRDHASGTEIHRTLMAVSSRSAFATKLEVARFLSLSTDAMDVRLRKACHLVWEYLDGWLEREVNRVS